MPRPTTSVHGPVPCPSAIVAIRINAGFTRTELAAEAGIDRTHLWRIECGRSEPSVKTLRALATALKVPISALLTDAPPAAS